MKKTKLEDVLRTLTVCGDEYERFAKAGAESYFKAAGGTIDAKDSLSDFESSLSDTVDAWHRAKDGSPEKRAALLRLAARASLVLVIDQHARGPRECDRIEGKLDEYGFLKRK